jgi:hypothetical protein
MVLIPNYLNSQATLVITRDLCVLFRFSDNVPKVTKGTKVKLDLLMKHSKWVSQVAMI